MPDRFGRVTRFEPPVSRFVDRLAGALPGATERVRSAQVVVRAIVEGQRAMSLLGKLNALTERATDFTKATEAGLDGLSAKIDAAEVKREAALAKHHGYYDAIAKGIDESVAVIDRLSNGPLDGSSGG